MKAERRHELKQNALAKVLTNAPDFYRDHAGKIIMAVVLLLALIGAVIFYIRGQRAALERAKQDLAAAQQNLETLQRCEANPYREDDPRILSDLRNDHYKNGLAAADAVLALASSSKTMRAQAYIVKGDLNWWMEHLSPLSGAATQPSLRPDKTPRQLLNDAETAYNTVLSQFADQDYQVAFARLGLAAVYEERAAIGDANASDLLNQAKDQLAAIVNDKKYPMTLSLLAQERLKELPDLRFPPLLNITPPPEPTTFPSTRPTTYPSVPPSTLPSTLPAVR